LAHWGGGLFFYHLLKKAVKETLKNVYYDTAASPFLYDSRIYRYAKDLIGLDKVLLGTDYPLLKPERYFKEMTDAGLRRDPVLFRPCRQICAPSCADPTMSAARVMLPRVFLSASMIISFSRAATASSRDEVRQGAALLAGLKRRRQVVAVDGPLFAEQHGPFDAVFQFTHIAGPVVGHEHIDGRRGEPLDLPAVLFGIALQKKVRQQQDIRFALPQRRHVDGKHVQPVIQVAAEGILLHGLLQVLVGGRDDAHVHLEGPVPADPLEFPLLQNAQQPHLHVGLDAADFVQEDGPLWASSKRPGFCLTAPVKAPFRGRTARSRSGCWEWPHS
jgi:hypothetical protein